MATPDPKNMLEIIEDEPCWFAQDFGLSFLYQVTDHHDMIMKNVYMPGDT